MERSGQREQVCGVLTQYLLQHGLRRTSERYAVLDAVYQMAAPFSVEQLVEWMNGKSALRVCTATVYNTLSLLCDAHLVLCHPQVGDRVYYEGCYGAAPRVYSLCDVCGRLALVSGAEVASHLARIKTPRFHAETCVVYVHGMCSSCAVARKRKMKEKLKHNKTKSK